jgi:hypothetical protein
MLQYLNFLQIFFTKTSSTSLVSKLKPKGTHGNLKRSPSFTHFLFKSFIQIGFFLPSYNINK